MKNSYIAFLLISLFMLFACNPKPTFNDSEVNETKSYTKIEHVERLFETNKLFEDDPLLAALNQLASYYDAALATDELSTVKRRYLDGDYTTTNVIEMIQDKGLTIFPKLAKYSELEEVILERKPVYVQFNLIGSTSLDVIMIGYSDDEFVMIDLKNGEELQIDRERLAGIKEYKAYIPFENHEKQDGNIEDSVLYLDLAISDAYYGNDGDRLLYYLTLVEDRNLESEVNAFRYLKAYYHTFFDHQLDVAEKLIQEDLQLSKTPPHLEIAFMIAHAKQDEERMKSILSQWQILPFYQDETLQVIIDKGEQLGQKDKAKQASEMLALRQERQK